MTTSAHQNGGGKDWLSLKAWAQAIGVVGIPGAIAIFLVYVGATQIPALVRQMDRVLAAVETNRELMKDLAQREAQIMRLTQQVCVNAAKDDNARARCFDN